MDSGVSMADAYMDTMSKGDPYSMFMVSPPPRTKVTPVINFWFVLIQQLIDPS